jgi:hypothetical protein
VSLPVKLAIEFEAAAPTAEPYCLDAQGFKYRPDSPGPKRPFFFSSDEPPSIHELGEFSDAHFTSSQVTMVEECSHNAPNRVLRALQQCIGVLLLEIFNQIRFQLDVTQKRNGQSAANVPHLGTEFFDFLQQRRRAAHQVQIPQPEGQ